MFKIPSLLAGLSFLGLYNPFVPKRSMPQKSIVVLTCSYNNSKWYRWNLDAIRKQAYDNFKCIYVDDCSTDGTGDLVQAYIDEYDLADKIILVRNNVRRGAMYNQYMAIHNHCQDDDIVIICDGDDWFAHNRVLAYINEVYSSGDIWLTYGQFKEYQSGHIGFCRPMPQQVIEQHAFRSHVHIPSHLRTFYARLFKLVKAEDFMYEGEFLAMCCDMAAMIPMIEMAADHFKFIDQVLLEYNDQNDLNDYKVSRELQQKLDHVIRTRMPYPKLATLFDEQPMPEINEQTLSEESV